MNVGKAGVTRRRFLAAGGVGAALAAMPSSAAGATEPTATETANGKVVMDMCKMISSVKSADIAPFLADDFSFQLFDGQPLVEGKETFLAFVDTFFAPFERAEFIVHRTHVIGNLVINDRTDRFFAKEGGTNQTFEVTGFCVVKNGKIHEWKDYGLPSADAR